jgi:hypothetical protein
MIKSPNDPLTVKILRNEIKSYLTRTGKDTKEERKYVARQNPENVIVAFSRPFKGVCNKCGKRGHKAVNGRVPVNDANAAQGQRLYNDQKKFTGTCH